MRNSSNHLYGFRNDQNAGNRKARRYHRNGHGTQTLFTFFDKKDVELNGIGYAECVKYRSVHMKFYNLTGRLLSSLTKVATNKNLLEQLGLVVVQRRIQHSI